MKEKILFIDKDLSIEVNISPKEDTVWLAQEQMAQLFGVQRAAVTKHINNIYKSEELNELSTSSKMEHMGTLGKQAYSVNMYNLDMIISVGYRVNSKRGILFRKWATGILKEYALKGYAANKRKLANLNQIIHISKRTTAYLDSNEILSVLDRYTQALNLLDDYDHQKIKRPKGNRDVYYLTYDEAKAFIMQMRFHEQSALFGLEREKGFISGLSSVYQTFDGTDLYPSVEEKAANLLYLLVKNHGFVDGNKRIGSALFLYFLDKNNRLIKDNELIISNHTLVALAILIAQSKPAEKEVMIDLIMNFIV